MASERVQGAAQGAQMGAKVGSFIPGIGNAIGAGIGALIGAFTGGGGGGPAGFTGLDVSGEASLAGFTGGQFFGNARNSEQPFRWQSHDHNATGQLSDVIKAEFGRLSGAYAQLGGDPAALSAVKVPFQFTVTKAGQPSGAGPTTAEIVGDFQQGILPQISDQIARALVPGVTSAAELIALAENPGGGAALRQSVGAGPAGRGAGVNSSAPAGVPAVPLQIIAAESKPAGGDLLAWLTLAVGAMALKG